MNILNDIQHLSRDILKNKEYTRLYYPTNDAIRNKGYLTMISEQYITYFSKISNYITNYVSNIKNMKKDSNNIKEKLVNEIVEGSMRCSFEKNLDTSSSRVELCDVSIDVRKELMLEIINRTINVKFGNTIRNYRDKEIKRNNEVSFRTSITVKCEKKIRIAQTYF